MVKMFRSQSMTCFRRKKRKSRWTDESSKTFIPGLPTMIPGGMTKEQEEAYLCKYQIIGVSKLYLVHLCQVIVVGWSVY